MSAHPASQAVLIGCALCIAGCNIVFSYQPPTRKKDAAAANDAGIGDGADASNDGADAGHDSTDATLDSIDARSDSCPDCILLEDIMGHWKVTDREVQDIYFKIVDGRVRGVYANHDGRTLCDYIDPVLTCWWTEVEGQCDRSPPDCAGNEEYVFTAEGAEIVGVNNWGYGDTTNWEKSCSMTFVSSVIPAQLDALFNNDEEFVEKPPR